MSSWQPNTVRRNVRLSSHRIVCGAQWNWKQIYRILKHALQPWVSQHNHELQVLHLYSVLRSFWKFSSGLVHAKRIIATLAHRLTIHLKIHLLKPEHFPMQIRAVAWQFLLTSMSESASKPPIRRRHIPLFADAIIIITFRRDAKSNYMAFRTPKCMPSPPEMRYSQTGNLSRLVDMNRKYFIIAMNQ